ncbi:HD domain-containing phosphohydrolase [Catenovulum adriaticum]|uniref:Transporter substrate-binding domain-containing protein n=1 Tax=Catenovulum adriaticum TaxID=2984846 RepID=A0ABY7AQT5_9ALTE|nr:HD domain-containing phosphohydrolase [Catenovulum sp. TS8]WAJ71496.1 transporter substrate-binding domain-containing protein [Catenovulum sp. TS8]
MLKAYIDKFKNKLHFSIRLTVVSVFVMATAITACVAISLQYYFSQKMAVESSMKLFNLTTYNTVNHLAQINQSAENTLKLLSKNKLLQSSNSGLKFQIKQQFAQIMQNAPLFYALYIGEPDGDFYELINLNTSQVVRKQLKAIEQDRWVVIKIIDVNGNKVKQTFYYDENFKLRISLTEPSEYDPRKRLWFTQAKHNQVLKTAPYLFSHLKAPGQTYSIKIQQSNRVLAVDIALSALSEYLNRQDKEYNSRFQSEMYIFQKSGDIVASNLDPQIETLYEKPTPLKLSKSQQALVAKYPSLTVSNETNWPPIDFSVAGKPKGYSIDLLNRVSQLTGIQFNYINGHSWAQFLTLYQQGDIDILQPVFPTPENQKKGILSQPLLSLPFSLATHKSQNSIQSLADLKGKTLAIPEGWSVLPFIKKFYPEINVVTVNNTQDLLHQVAFGNVDAGLDNHAVLLYTQQQYFINDIEYHPINNFSPNQFPQTLHLLVQKDKQEILSLINEALKQVSTRFKKQLKEKWLNEKVSQVKTLGAVPYPELIQRTQAPEKQGKLSLVTLNGIEKYVYVSPLKSDANLLSNKNNNTDYLAIVVNKDDIFSHSRAQIQFSILITAGCLFLVLPISWYFASPIVLPVKRLSEEAEKIKNREYDKISTLSSSIIEIESLAKSMLRMGRAVERHEQNQKALIESFIQLIAQAIDDKSPYTAGHCERVPKLGIMLAKAASESDKPPFNQFEFKNNDEFREFSIAAWLHDCGKITTPEHIVDKGTKLETIYNRIHEIRMRFEVLWRDAEIEYYKKLAQPSSNKVQLKQQLKREQSKLIQDFAFIASTNVGSEFLNKASEKRLDELAKITWLRHFDDKIGLSPLEELKMEYEDEQLPVIENLLADKKIHLISHDKPIKYDKKLGIKVKPPKYKYNLGELHNLKVGRGTLTAEDRFKINEHIISTIKMLEQVPFPDELSKVPRYASTHHETLKGTGYPRKLSAKDLSIPERVLVLADIFEALTAADRPYKKAKPLSVAIKILHKMVLDEHVDKDIFELFLTSGIYLQYAKTYLTESQIDEIDIRQYLG